MRGENLIVNDLILRGVVWLCRFFCGEIFEWESFDGRGTLRGISCVEL